MKELNLIRKIAWSFHQTTGIEWDDLFSEACLAYSEALSKFNPSKSKLSTYVYWCINSHLKNYIKNLNHCQIETISLDEIQHMSLNEDSKLFEKLSKEASIVAELVLQNIVEYSILPRQKAKQKVVKEMTKINGCTMKHAWIGVRDLKMALG